MAGALAGSAVSLQTHLVAAAGLLVVISSLVATQVLPVDEVHVEKAAPDEAPGRRITPRGLMVRLFIAGLAAVTIEVASMNWAAFRITDDLGGASSTGALAFAAVMAGGTIIRFAGDHLSHILGDARFTAGSAALAMVGLVAAAVVDVPALVVGSFLLAGMGIATLTPRLYDMGARAGSGTAAGLGWLTAGMRIATMATPAAVAALATRTSVGVAIAAAGVAAGVLFLAATANIITDQRRA